MTSVQRVVWVLVVVLVLVGGAIGAVETLGRSWLADQIASGLQQEQFLPARPAVEITGGSLALGLAQGRLDAVEIDAPAWPLLVNDHEVVFQGVSLDARSIRIEGDRAIVGEVVGDGRLEWSALSTIIGMPVSDAGGGRVRVTYENGAVAQQLFELSAELRLDAQTQELTLAAPQVVLGGVKVPSVLVDRVLAAVAKPLPITLDQGVRLTAIVPGEAGVSVAIAVNEFPVTWRS